MAGARRMLVAAAAAFLLVELVVRALAPVLGPPLTFYNINTQAKAAQFQALGQAGDDPAVVFLGNSTVREGVDIAAFEREAGVTAYNAGLQSATTYVVRRFLEREILRNVTPDVVVYGLTAGSYAEADDVQTARYDEAPATRRTRPSWVKRTAEDWLYLWRYRNDLRDPRTGSTLFRSLRYRSTDEGALARALREMTTHGDLPSRSASGYGTAPVVIAEDSTAAPAPVPAASRRDLRILASELREAGVQLVLVNMPTTSVDPSFTASVRELGEALDVPVLDLKDVITTQAEFVDGVHLNGPGATHLSAVLAEHLRPFLG